MSNPQKVGRKPNADGREAAPEWIFECDIKSVKVPFGSGTAKHILDPKLTKIYDSTIASLLGIHRSGNGFPGTLAVSVMRKDLFKLKKDRYLILLKSDGIRYWMLLLSYKNDSDVLIHVAVMIDRTFTHRVIVSSFPKSVFDGTIFDGELIECKDGWEYQIFDCVAYGGKFIGNLPFRIETAKRCTEKYVHSPSHPFKIVVKKVVTPSVAIQALFDDNPRYPVDGLILINPMNQYLSGIDKELFKWKRYKDHTIDLKVCTTETNINSLCVSEKGRGMNPVQSPCGFTAESFVRLNVSNEQMLVGRVLECRWDENRLIWEPMMIRWDKDMPNNLGTYNLTVQNITEKITSTEIFRIMNE